jgi:glycosyltransferase involved in cell wall biosynthesis
MPVTTMWREGVAGEGRPDGALPAAAPSAARSEGRARPRAHICFVAPYVWPVLSRDPEIRVVGGAEVQQSILARLLVAGGFRVSMICFDYGQPSPVEVEGVTVWKSVRHDAGLPVLRFVHPRLTTMWRLMREIDADVYYQRSSAVWTGIMAAFCRRHRKRSIYAGASDHDFLPGNEQIKFARDRWIYRRGLKTVDRIVAQNAYQVATCREHFGRDAVQIPSCYVLPLGSRKASPENDRVLWVGTVHDYKRPEMFLEIARRMPQRRFVMVGGPSPGGERFRPGYFEGIRAQAAALPNVEFTGFLPLAQVEPWFDRARAVVSTSVYEGMPNVFLQAWARGVPTVATVDVGVSVNTVFDSMDAAVATIDRFFTDEKHWQEKSGQALEYFEANHSAGHVLERYGALIEELVS